jgi:K+-transporting ATPase ATPase A chain
MTLNGWVQIAVFCVVIVLLTRPFGGYMTRVFSGERTLLSPVLRPVERSLYRLCGVDEAAEQHWVTYAVAMLFFSMAGFVTLYALQRLQGVLPFNPQGQAAVEQSLAFNTSVSFVTNTNWQSYSPETTMSYLVQMGGLTVHNFVSAATGIALAIALVRGFARRSAQTVGNFWVDMVRCTLYILLPVAIVVGLFFVQQGVPQNLNTYTDATTLEGARQVIAQGPVASQEVIKMLGTNGGGFFNANSAHPFENPTLITNLIEAVALLVIAAALVYTFGKMVGNTRQGWAVFAAMAILFWVGIILATWAEGDGNPILVQAGANQSTEINGLSAPGGNMESKEVRFGIPLSTQWAVATTDASNGSVNSMHDSYTPLGGMAPNVLMALG